MKNIKFSPEGKAVFFVSFIIGTILLGGYAVTKSSSWAVAGFCFVVIAAVVNCIMFFTELFAFVTNVADNKAHGNSALLLLLNIPVTALYILIVFNI